jgi:hypothetical protein
MKISAEEALDLLRKWMSEHTPLTVLVAFPDSEVVAKISGFIHGLSDDILISDVIPTPQVQAPNYLIFPAAAAREFDYGEPKDFKQLPKEQRDFYIAKFGPANLRIVMSGGYSVSFFEAPSN